MQVELQNKTRRVQTLLERLKSVSFMNPQIVALIFYGSYSTACKHEPTLYSDVDIEIVIQDEMYLDFVKNFDIWFTKNIEPILICTSLPHLEKMYFLRDFVEVQIHFSRFSTFGDPTTREMNYFPRGFEFVFDKSKTLTEAATKLAKSEKEISKEEKLKKLDNSFWYFIVGLAQHIERENYWSVAQGYWLWLYNILVEVIRISLDQETRGAQLQHIDQIFPPHIQRQLLSLRVLHTNRDIVEAMKNLIKLYEEFVVKAANTYGLDYDDSIARKSKDWISQFISNK